MNKSLRRMFISVKPFVKGCLSVVWFLFIQFLALSFSIFSWSVVDEQVGLAYSMVNGFDSLDNFVGIGHLFFGIFVGILGTIGCFYLLTELIVFFVFVWGMFKAKSKWLYIKDGFAKFFAWIID